MPRRDYNKKPEVCGSEIYFKRGKYEGLRGWHDDEFIDTGSRVYVVVELSDGKFRRTFVKTTSIATKVKSPPSDYAQAIIQQQPKIEKLLDDLAVQLAMIHVGDRIVKDPGTFWREAQDRYLSAFKEQQKKGYSADWKFVDLSSLPEKDEDDEEQMGWDSLYHELF